ncbi:hypothetical protein AVU99_gp113 [Mycobacterium phage Lolly9]|uniref:Helix-turn-helix DNA binding domain protein n=1 Tax=Mycobacterium phage Lolly9 TaxID=1698711 RepID=A0A0K2FNB6_9CAUD|nr:hypothetical protein AVU99_gp113 [Mycobacterium phage Lolly9]ALA48484.1 hypothetical protein LOLLY9_67 [Mycobacterium phage Lolly9]QOP65795.1 hypothetical protein PBI_MINILON_71 [Mycobacterium phage MiniLon]QOP66542.1 hypothetical protein PBI_MINIMAC_71 [Mycobacterium phage MiniMac]
MSDFGRIDRKFWDHPKAKQAGNAALGLWAKANSWCRDNRSGGFVPRDVVLELGTRDEANALVSARLWKRVDKDGAFIGVQFNDYDHWNDDVEPNTVAGDLVRKVVPESQPLSIRKQLVKKTAEMLREGIDAEILERALNLWLAKDFGPGILPNLVSEAQKEAQRAATLRNTITKCLETGQVSPLKAYGYIFTPPVPPDGLDVNQRRDWMAGAKRDWLNELRGRVAA